MQMKDLSDREVYRLIELYFKHNTEFLDMLTIEDFTEQYCRKCDNCGRVICILDMCDECDEEKEENNEFRDFEENKDYYLHGIR